MKCFLFFILFFNVCFTEAAEHEGNGNDVPLKGNIMKFSDPYGPYQYTSEIIHYKSEDKALIEATVVIPKIDRQMPGLVFVHMWARDRNTFWGLPEFLATYGYPSIYFDLRGHGNSKFPSSDKKVTTKDRNANYDKLYLDILPAIDILNNKDFVKKDNLILIGASLGCPLGVLAVEKTQDKFIGMIHLSPATVYFDVNCKNALKKIRIDMPVYVICEETDKSFSSAKHFFNMINNYKTCLVLKGVGHGSDVLYRDIGFPTIILNWIEQIRVVYPSLINIHKLHFKTY